MVALEVRRVPLARFVMLNYEREIGEFRGISLRSFWVFLLFTVSVSWHWWFLNVTSFTSQLRILMGIFSKKNRMERYALGYKEEYGLHRLLDDRFGGQPKWVERALWEYERGPFGPKHVCLELCSCSRCLKLMWLWNPVCHCKIGNLAQKSLTLDSAMREKWLRCRCSLVIADEGDEGICPCIMVVPTQEFNWNLSSSNNSPPLRVLWTGVAEGSEFKNCDCVDEGVEYAVSLSDVWLLRQ